MTHRKQILIVMHFFSFYWNVFLLLSRNIILKFLEKKKIFIHTLEQE